MENKEALIQQCLIKNNLLFSDTDNEPSINESVTGFAFYHLYWRFIVCSCRATSAQSLAFAVCSTGEKYVRVLAKCGFTAWVVRMTKPNSS